MTQNVVLIADIGGTHARFAVVTPDGSVLHPAVLHGADFPDIQAVCTHYCQSLPDDMIVRDAVWAVAGPVTADRVTITNRGWTFSSDSVKKHFGWDRFHVLNDFAALALSLPHLQEADKIRVKQGVADPEAPSLVLGPGTGLGVASLVPDGHGGHRVVPGEGGHVGLPVGTDDEAFILKQMQDVFGYVCAERVLSGSGLVHLYRIMGQHKGLETPHDKPQAVIAGAYAGDDKLAQDAVEQFCVFLGRLAGDAALTTGARGGVYLAGGILPSMPDRLVASGFSRAFTQKGVVTPYMEAIPVWLVTHPLPAFVGLRFFAQPAGK